MLIDLEHLRLWEAEQIAKIRGQTIPAWKGMGRDTVVRTVDDSGEEIGDYLVIDYTMVGAPTRLGPDEFLEWYRQSLPTRHIHHVAATKINLNGELPEVTREPVYLAPEEKLKVIGFFWRG